MFQVPSIVKALSCQSACPHFCSFSRLICLHIEQACRKPPSQEDGAICWGDIFWKGVWGSGRRENRKSGSRSILAPVCCSVCCWVTSICSSGDGAINHALLDYAKHYQCFLTVIKKRGICTFLCCLKRVSLCRRFTLLVKRSVWKCWILSGSKC